MRRNIIIAGLTVTCLFLLSFSVYGEVSLESYCKDGYYQIPGEKKCSRAPKCGGKTYEDLNKAEFMPNNNDCLDEGHGMVIGDPPNTSAFYGYYPLCCYEMARLKDPEMCIGYWERLWCHPDQCAQIDNTHGCGGGGCNCAHATKGWCEIRHCTMKPPVPLEVRLGMTKPTATPAPPTVTPMPTAVPVPTTPSYPTSIPVEPTKNKPNSGPFIIATPVPTAAPFIIPTSVIPSPADSSGLNLSFTLPVNAKIALRSAIIGADKGFRLAGNAVGAVRQADAGLENYINSLLQRLLSLITRPQ